MTLRYITIAVLAITLTGRATGNDDAAARDRVTLIVLAPNGPVLIEVRISVGDQPYRAWVSRFLAERLDVDSSNALSEAEIGLIPDRMMQVVPGNSAMEILRAAAGSDSATEVTRERFETWLSKQLSRSLQVIAEPQPPAEAVRLGPLVDANNDGRVSSEELAAGSHGLRFRDLDDDQTFSATELLPFRDPRNQQAAVTPDSADLPFLQLTDEEATENAVALLLKRYGEDEAIPFALLRSHPQLLRKFDSDNSSSLNADELAAFLAEPFFHQTWDVQLSSQSSRSRIDVSTSPFARRFAKAEPLRRGRLRLTIDDMPIEIRSRGGLNESRFLLEGLLGQHFSIADQDKDGMLAEDEFGGITGTLAQAQLVIDFAQADLDDDNYVSRAEINSLIDRQTISAQSHVEVTVRQDGKTLFSLLDRNSDRRLAPRELREGSAVLTEYDVNGDQQLAESELGTEYVLQIGLGQLEAMRGNDRMMSMPMMSTDAVLPGIDSLTGPQWFRRMDRNQDGDLSRREFLGTSDQFRQIDANSDTLISAEEAEAAGRDSKS